MKNTYIFHVAGMHCHACILMTESELMDIEAVKAAKSSLETHTVEIVGDFGDKTPQTIADELTRVLQKHGYTLSINKQARTKNLREFFYAVPITFAFIVAFFALQKAGLVNLIDGGSVTYGTAFVVGIVASLSTCMAVVGGLVLSLSATFAMEGEKTRPQVLFHAARLAAFFLLGGAIGALGSAFQLSGTAAFVLSLLIGVIMFVLGMNLLDVFVWAKRLQPAMPRFISRRALSVSKLNHSLTPVLAGVATFFLPCGFTQSMQLYTLSTGTFLRGGLTMLAFALGTFPVLALISFSSYSIEKNRNRGVFFKTAGLIVILFALFNVLNAFVAAGYIKPFFNI